MMLKTQRSMVLM